MTRSSVNPPQCGVADRYDAESHPSDDFVNVFGEGSDLPDHINDTCTIAGGASSHPRPMMLHASKQLIEHLNDGNEEFLDVNGVAEFLQIPRTQAHCIVDVLEVFQIIIPRGPMYTWRGTTHVALLLQSDKFKAGATMQTGIAVPKVCRAMIPHLRDHVGVEFTVGTMANWLWEAQDTSEAIATIAEAHAQQQRALRELIADVLAVVEALGLIDYAPCPKRGAVYLFNPHSQSQLISPKGMQQSARMRNMRVMFDGPAPTQTARPGTSATHRSNPRSTGASSRPYTAATIGAVPHRGRARPPYNPHLQRNASPEESSYRPFPIARLGRTPPPPLSHTRNTVGHGRQVKGIYAARAATPPIAPKPHVMPQSLPSSSEQSWRAERMAGVRAELGRDEDVRSGVYPTTSEWCSMQQELIDRGGFEGASMHEDVFSTESPDSMPQLCEDTRRVDAVIGRAVGMRGPAGPRDVSCSGRVEGGADRFALSYGPTAAVRQNSNSRYNFRQAYPGSGGSRLAGKVGGGRPERRSSSMGPRGEAVDAVRDVDNRTAGGVSRLKHMFETTRMSRIGGLSGSARVHHMVQRYEGGDAR